VARTGRPRSFDDQQTVEGAKASFWRHGYAATSMRDLGEELDVLPGSLHGAYGSKHALFLLALERYAAAGREATASLLDDVPVLPHLRRLLRDALDAARAAPGRGCMLGNTATELLPGDTAAARVVRHGFADLEQAIERALRLGQESGEIRADLESGPQARLLLALIQGLHVTARAEADPRRLEDAIDAALAPLAAIAPQI
jgi:TetR/AcrR family transcriptional repressor of nem operon